MSQRQVRTLRDGVFLLLYLLEVGYCVLVSAYLILRHTQQIDIIAHNGHRGGESLDLFVRVRRRPRLLSTRFRRLLVRFQVVHRLIVISLAVVYLPQHTVQLTLLTTDY